MNVLMLILFKKWIIFTETKIKDTNIIKYLEKTSDKLNLKINSDTFDKLLKIYNSKTINDLIKDFNKNCELFSLICRKIMANHNITFFKML